MHKWLLILKLPGTHYKKKKKKKTNKKKTKKKKKKKKYSNILKILPTKIEHFQVKNRMFFIFCSKHRLPQFYYIKEGFKGSTLYRHVFVMAKVESIPTIESTASARH